MARILVIEDQKEIADIMQTLLEYGAHFVMLAFDGEHGLQMARTQSPDLIILDVYLPKMDGPTLNKLLLKDEKTSNIPVMVISTQSPDENMLVTQPNVKRYLQKPFDPMTLLDEIRAVLSPNT